MSAAIRLLLVAVASVPLPALSAQIYKWVDERGVTNYSNRQPDRAAAPGKFGIVESKISVYTPDPALTQAVDAFRMRSNEISARRAAPETVLAERYSVPVYVPAPAAIEPCSGYGPAHCDESYTGYDPYSPVAGHRFYRGRYKRVPQVRIKPGTIAGQVVGMDGYIPGNSANARRFAPPQSRFLSRPALEPGFTGGRPIQLPSRFR